MKFKHLEQPMVRTRRSISIKRHGKNLSPSFEKMNCCKDCKTMDLPWYRVDEEIKYGWKKLKLSQNATKPCICWHGSLGDSECRKKELAFMNDYFVQTKFSRCNKKMKIEFVSNGNAVRDIIREEEENLLLEQERLAVIQRDELEKQKVQRLKEILLEWEQTHQFPSSEQVPLTPSDLEKQANQSLPKSEYKGIPQIYILKFPKLHLYYVGATAKGYPKRVTEHCNGEKSNVSNNLEFKDEGYEKNLLTEIMEIVQPYDVKCGWCEKHANVLEFWMQERLIEAGLTHHWKGRDTGLFPDKHCKKCVDFARKYKIPWKP